jgi:uncharacterized protein YndB with AHSA1/START domain
MTPTKAPSPTTLVLRRTYKAPRERVFAAWADPKILQTFLGPNDVKIPELEMDFRVGGKYRIMMLPPDGERLHVGGVYREIRKPERIVFTWQWEESDVGGCADRPLGDSPETLVTLDFFERGGQTELVLTHENFRDEYQRDRHEHGWSAIFVQLDGVLA